MAFQDLSKRLLISFLSLVIIAAVLIFAYNPFVMWILAVGIALIGAVGIWEYGKLTKLDEKNKSTRMYVANIKFNNTVGNQGTLARERSREIRLTFLQF